MGELGAGGDEGALLVVDGVGVGEVDDLDERRQPQPAAEVEGAVEVGGEADALGKLVALGDVGAVDPGGGVPGLPEVGRQLARRDGEPVRLVIDVQLLDEQPVVREHPVVVGPGIADGLQHEERVHRPFVRQRDPDGRLGLGEDIGDLGRRVVGGDDDVALHLEGGDVDGDAGITGFARGDRCAHQIHGQGEQQAGHLARRFERGSIKGSRLSARHQVTPTSGSRAVDDGRSPGSRVVVRARPSRFPSGVGWARTLRLQLRGQPRHWPRLGPHRIPFSSP